MPAKRYRVKLEEGKRKGLNALANKGKGSVRLIRRAQMLLMADDLERSDRGKQTQFTWLVVHTEPTKTRIDGRCTWGSVGTDAQVRDVEEDVIWFDNLYDDESVFLKHAKHSEILSSTDTDNMIPFSARCLLPRNETIPHLSGLLTKCDFLNRT